MRSFTQILLLPIVAIAFSNANAQVPPDFAAFAACMEGPASSIANDCGRFDYARDASVDLLDAMFAAQAQPSATTLPDDCTRFRDLPLQEGQRQRNRGSVRLRNYNLVPSQQIQGVIAKVNVRATALCNDPSGTVPDSASAAWISPAGDFQLTGQPADRRWAQVGYVHTRRFSPGTIDPPPSNEGTWYYFEVAGTSQFDLLPNPALYQRRFYPVVDFQEDDPIELFIFQNGPGSPVWGIEINQDFFGFPIPIVIDTLNMSSWLDAVPSDVTWAGETLKVGDRMPGTTVNPCTFFDSFVLEDDGLLYEMETPSVAGAPFLRYRIVSVNHFPAIHGQSFTPSTMRIWDKR